MANEKINRDEAILVFNQILENDSNHALSHFELGLLYEQTNKEKSIQHLNQFLKLISNNYAKVYKSKKSKARETINRIKNKAKDEGKLLNKKRSFSKELIRSDNNGSYGP